MTTLERIEQRCKEAKKEVDEFHKPPRRATLYNPQNTKRKNPKTRK